MVLSRLFISRATALFRITSVAILCEILATPVSAYLMTRDPWTPYMLGLGIATLGAFSALLMPETLPEAKSKTSSADAVVEEETHSDPSAKRSMRQHIKGKLRGFLESTQFVTGSPAITVCLFSLFITSISKQSTSLLLQYTSKRFHWSIADVSSVLVATLDLMEFQCADNFQVQSPYLITRLHYIGKLPSPNASPFVLTHTLFSSSRELERPTISTNK